jgi:hypothetical protein
MQFGYEEKTMKWMYVYSRNNHIIVMNMITVVSQGYVNNLNDTLN